MFSAKLTRASLVAAAITCWVSAVRADTIEVKGQGVKFVPDVIRANVGDTIAFRSMSTHYVEIVKGMWPEGAPEMKSEMSKDYDYPIVKEGLYVFKCPPHWGARMGGVMVVGKPADLDAKVDDYLKVADTEREAKPAAYLLRKFQEVTAAPP
jgi:pseudoazurin